MAEAKIDLDKLTAKHFTLSVRINRLHEWEWRLKLALLLCRLAAKIAWLKFELIREIPPDPWLYYCQRCGRDIADYKPCFERYLVISCPHCHYQSLVVGGGEEPVYVTEEGLGAYACDCHWQEPYGFVPATDCPIHDKSYE